MAFFLRRILKQLLFAAAAAFVVRKMLESSNPRAQRIGRTANRFMGGVGTTEASGRRSSRS